MPEAAVPMRLPEGQPSHRFMRYVRPPIKDDDKHPPLYPLRPANRPLRLGIDVVTIPAPPDGTFSTFLDRDELDIQLLVPKGTEVAKAWVQALPDAPVRQIGFTTVAEASRHLDTVEFRVTTESEQQWGWTLAHFFPVYQQLDEQLATPVRNLSPSSSGTGRRRTRRPQQRWASTRSLPLRRPWTAAMSQTTTSS